MNVPMSDTGTATTGISVARQFWRNRYTTRTTSTIASTSVIDDLADAFATRRCVVSSVYANSRSAGKRACELLHLRADAFGDRERVGAGRLEHRNRAAGLRR